MSHPLHKKAIFLVWAKPTFGSSRSRFLARELEIAGPDYVSFGARRGWLNLLLRYPVQAWQTVRLLWKKRPAVVLVQSPPTPAVLISAIYCRLTGGQVVIDAHSDTFQRRIWTWPGWLYRRVARGALAFLVTDNHFKQIVESWGGRAIVMRSPVTWYDQEAFPLNGHFNVTMVNSFAADEPLEEVLKAAGSLPGVHFYVTGKVTSQREELVRRAPPNVTFTGFLPEQQYFGLLKASHAVMSLTTRDHTFQCGACEALSLERPILTSDWPLLREYFSQGTVHVDNTSAGICRGVEAMQRDYQRFEGEVVELRKLRSEEWHGRVAELVDLIHQG